MPSYSAGIVPISIPPEILIFFDFTDMISTIYRQISRIDGEISHLTEIPSMGNPPSVRFRTKGGGWPCPGERPIVVPWTIR